MFCARGRVDRIAAANLRRGFPSRCHDRAVTVDPPFAARSIYRCVHLKWTRLVSLLRKTMKEEERERGVDACRDVPLDARTTTYVIRPCLSRRENRCVSHGGSTVENGKITNVGAPAWEALSFVLP